MSKTRRLQGRLLYGRLFLVIAVVLAIPLTVWSLNNVPTQTVQHAAMPSYYYSQYSSAWQSNCSLAKYGCFETSLAMALKRFIGSSYNPWSVAKAVNNGCTSGTNLGEQDTIMKGYAQENGLTTIKLRGSTLDTHLVIYGSKKFNYSLAKKYIDNGYMLILSGCMKFYNPNDTLSSNSLSHAIAVIGVDPSTHILTALDPTKDTGIRYFNADNDIKDCPGVVNGWVSAYAVKKYNTGTNKCLLGLCPM